MSLDNPEALKRWLSEKPSPWSLIIAIRMALRLLPVVNQETKSPSPLSNSETIISVFQAYCLSWAVHRFSIRDIINTSFKSSNTMLPVIASCINVAAKSAIVGADTVTAIESYQISAAAQLTIQAAYPGDIDKFWKQIDRDVLWLEAQAGNDAPSQATKLAEQPLWYEEAPQSLQTDWNNFKLSVLASDHGFQPWIRWYEAIAPFDARTTPRDLFSEGLTRRIASQPSDWWERPALAINTDIARWLEEDTAQKPLSDNIALPWRDPPSSINSTGGQDLPTNVGSDDDGIAQIYLDETREMADSLLEVLSDSNVNPDIRRAVGKLRETLTNHVGDLRPALVDSRTLRLELLAKMLNNPQDSADLSPTILAGLLNLSFTARRLCQSFPDPWQQNVEQLVGSITKSLDQLPDQQPAPYQFDWRDGRMEVLPPGALPNGGMSAQRYLDETRDKADSLLDTLARSNCDPGIARKVERLRSVLTDQAADLIPEIVNSRTIAVERLAKWLDNPRDREELSSLLLSDVDDLAETARLLCDNLPELSKENVRKLTAALTTNSAVDFLTNLNSLRDGIKDAKFIGPGAQAAFDTLHEECAEPADDDLQRHKIALYGVTVRNFLNALLRVQKWTSSATAKTADATQSFAKELIKFTQEVRGNIRPEAAKLAAKWIVVTTVSTTAVAALYVTNYGTIREIVRYFSELERVTDSLDMIRSGTVPPPSAPPPVPPAAPPRAARPTSEKGPTRPA